MELENLVTLYAFIEDKKLVFNVKGTIQYKKSQPFTQRLKKVFGMRGS